MLTDTNTQIAFDTVGDGAPALLFLPGWCGDRTVFNEVVPRTGRHRLSVCMDWRSHGTSAPAEGDFGLEELVEDCLSVIDEAGIDQIVPAPAAHAGWVGIELRRRLGPERVPGIVLLDWMVLGAPQPFQPVLQTMQNPDAREGAIDRLTGMWTEGVSSAAVRQYVASMRAYDGEMWSRAAREISASFAHHPAPLEALAELETPTLHLYTQPRDEGFLAAQQQYAADHPWFQVQRLPGASHFPQLECPEETAAAIEAFLWTLS
jgi:pimeloyl-ACP methyl ester carboxylesterase